ncbi:MAG: ABC transporter ATP-binding protein [Cytophagales bacterium]|nr:MAG: ABC transporter ATP-binding protein [Cytophagales bacterium]
MFISTSEDFSIGYKQKILHQNLPLCIEKNKLICLLGANGSGKSTLLRTLAGLQKPLKGNVFIEQNKLQKLSNTQIAQLISIVFTKTPTPTLKVVELMQISLFAQTNWWGNLNAMHHHRIANVLKNLQIQHLAEQTLYELSDGQLQKVMIARALVQNTPIIILDEPTAHLDLLNRIQIFNLLKKTTIEEQKTILIATHDWEIAQHIADEIWFLDTKNGLKIVKNKNESLHLDYILPYVTHSLKNDEQLLLSKILKNNN